MAQAHQGKLARLENKKEMLFSRMNRIFDLTKNISSFESRSNELFLTESETIDDIRDRYESIVDQINDITLSMRPDANPDYACLDAFEDLFIRVKRVRNKINSTTILPPRSRDDLEVVAKVINLPPIELPKFDGRTENWPVFYESFKSNIHCNKQLSDSQRVQYLMGKLTHNALKLTAGIVPTGDTYNIIWDSLVKKYQDKRALGTHYLNNILDLKSSLHNSNSLNSFVEKYSCSIAALRQLEIPDLSDFILLHCALRKTDYQTSQAFEMSVRNVEIPGTQQFISFVQDQAKILERLSGSIGMIAPSSRNSASYRPSVSTARDWRVQNNNHSKSFLARDINGPAVGIAPSVANCVYCKRNDHFHLYDCKEFKKLPSAKDRFEIIKSRQGCVNCLSLRHSLSNCKASSVCKVCSKRHHTLLHFEQRIKNTNAHVLTSTDPQPSSSTTRSPSPQPLSSALVARSPSALPPPLPSKSLITEVKPYATILLATAQVYARPKGSSANKTIIRCLIDNGSQNNLITSDCCRSLNLPITPLTNSFVNGIGTTSRPILGYVYLDIESRVYPEQKFCIQALVVECITDHLPSHLIACDSGLSHLKDLPLADLGWNIPGEIQVVLGAQLFPYIYLGTRVDSNSRGPPAISTAFGYVLMGDYPHQEVAKTGSFTAIALNELLQTFWELEEMPQSRLLSPEDTECENLYISSVTQDDQGRYTVSLPFCKNPTEVLGNSRVVAYRRLMSLETKLNKSHALREKYNSVIQEYIDEGYLSQVADIDATDSGYYIPHHAIVRPDKPMPRIVLDASAKTHTGLSLNDILYPGANLQADLFLLLLDFRMFPIAMNADIRQMYLRIGVHPDHRKYLRILFRFNANELVGTYQFNRIPFGLKSSPYLAMRTVRQLATDLSPNYPEAAKIATSYLYMDDLVYSAPDERTAMQISKDLINLFKSGAFDLVKWSSNSETLLNSLPDSVRKPLDFNAENIASKILGLSWEPSNDDFFFTSTQFTEKCTKRNILSVVARLFDVLGLVAPVILYAKLLIKELWLNKLGWDQLAPDQIRKRFTALLQQFPLLDTLRIKRHIGVQSESVVRLVAFCDASINGYGCVVYVHCTDPAGINVRLLCAKSKVTPTKITTLARLELCAIVLMTKLIKIVRDAYARRIAIADIYAFSDSTIALSWIHSSPHRWSVFVSNRIAQCHENLAAEHYYHVAGIENPADCLSRGILPAQLLSHDLWWNGPSWLGYAPDHWPIKPFVSSNCSDLPEHKANILTVTFKVNRSIICELAKRLSSWDKLLHTVVYVLRFIRRKDNLKLKSIEGLIIAERVVIRAVQSVYFAQDINLIKAGKLPSKKLQSLAVFLDNEGLLRVGGRLSKSNLPYDAKYPALLPKHDQVVYLIIRHYHVLNCHTGPGLLISILRQRYWILDARTVVRSRIRMCNTCFRVNPLHPTPQMADLPSYRISEAKAFVHTGVDYAGPIRITLTRRRGQHAQKAYICLFVCLVTKAVHVELVSDLTSNAFVAAFKRFISRRGPVTCLYSDNGTNFVGAKAQLDELYDFLLSSKFQSPLLTELKSSRIEWKMIPPRSPHFGAMWESNIKSLKTHLYRVIGNQLLSYEELLTVLVQIECILNSRPLNVVSSDPHPEVITPAHFLMSSPLQHLPAMDLSDQPVNLLQRKQLLDNMIQSFWKKWHLEYLHTLQVRQKWATPDKPIQVGTVVLVGQKDSPPLCWPLGIVSEVYPGADNVVRVAMVKTRFGYFKRPVIKLYPIPTQ